MMQPAQIKQFLENFSAGSCSEAEHQQFIEWLNSAPVDEIEAILKDPNFHIYNNQFLEEEVDTALVSSIEAALDQYDLGKKRKGGNGKILSWRSISMIAAASILIIVSLFVANLYFKSANQKIVAKSAPKQLKDAILPGSNKAILTLSDGSAIILDDAKNGKVAQEGGTQIAKLANGQLVYNELNEKPDEVVFNTLTTPRGGQFKLTLPDGSEVWLNASSSIKYPTAFIGKERKVEITGEAYFEIAHNAAMPFKVNVNGMEVRVLGTHFNINAYHDEASVKTTLLEGSVRLTKGSTITMLEPGEQAQLKNDGNIKVVSNVDMDQVVAWKNGYFSFNRSGLKTVMRQLARWYDVDVMYEGNIPERQFGGKIDRNSNLSEVLKILEESKVHFSIEEKKIIVRP